MESNAARSLYTADEGEGSIFSIPNHTGTPERRLLSAILERAILDYVGNDAQEMEEAERWLFDDDSDDDPEQFSFSWLCRELDLEPKQIASHIKAMPKRGKSRIAPWYFAHARAADD